MRTAATTANAVRAQGPSPGYVKDCFSGFRVRVVRPAQGRNRRSRCQPSTTGDSQVRFRAAAGGANTRGASSLRCCLGCAVGFSVPLFVGDHGGVVVGTVRGSTRLRQPVGCRSPPGIPVRGLRKILALDLGVAVLHGRVGGVQGERRRFARVPGALLPCPRPQLSSRPPTTAGLGYGRGSDQLNQAGWRRKCSDRWSGKLFHRRSEVAVWPQWVAETRMSASRK